MKELILGSGPRGTLKKVFNPDKPYQNPITLDMMEHVKPDVVWDLCNLPLPFEDEEFDEIHAYEILEHTGAQGDWKFFFRQFDEFWRILKPNGSMCITVPRFDSIWAWGDPGHTRVLSTGSFSFLDQEVYGENTARTDYRPFKANFKVEYVTHTEHILYVVLRKR